MMNFLKSRKLREGLLFLWFGLIAGTVFRIFRGLWALDSVTGFDNDGGVLNWLSLAVPMFLAIGAILIFRSNKAAFQSSHFEKSQGISIMGIGTGLLLVQSGVMQILDYSRGTGLAFQGGEFSQQGFIFVFYIVMCLVFGLVQLVAVGFWKDFFAKAPLLYVSAILWGMSYLVMVYVFYAKSSSFVENFFVVAGAASMLLALLYLCKLFASVDPAESAKRMFVFGGIAAVLVGTYTMADLVLFFTGAGYFGDIPAQFQLTGAGMSIYILACMAGFAGKAARLPQEAPAAQAESGEEEGAAGEAGLSADSENSNET